MKNPEVQSAIESYLFTRLYSPTNRYCKSGGEKPPPEYRCISIETGRPYYCKCDIDDEIIARINYGYTFELER